MKKFVIYYRVSTKKQGDSGLGLDAQQRDVNLFLNNYAEEPYEVIGEFTDVKSGKNDGRPQLQEAMELVRKERADLLVAKIDRLSRKVSFIAGLVEDKKVNLRIASMPYADNFQIHIYAALAEQEREFISKRTKAALAEAKARGVKLGGDRGSLKQRNEALMKNADRFAQKVSDVVVPMRNNGSTLKEIADALKNAGVEKARGGLNWTPTDVKRVIERVA